jgi:hypothetical protein
MSFLGSNTTNIEQKYEVFVMVTLVMETHCVFCKVRNELSKTYPAGTLVIRGRSTKFGGSNHTAITTGKCNVHDDFQFDIMKG